MGTFWPTFGKFGNLRKIHLPCSKQFNPKFRTISDNWIAYSSSGVNDTIAPKSKITWDVNEDGNEAENINFDIDHGLYTFSTIEKFDKLQTFSGEQSSIIATIRNNIDSVNSAGIVDGQINIHDAFPDYWSTIKDKMFTGFSFIGNICSIIIGAWTIGNLIKNILFSMVNCLLLKRFGESIGKDVSSCYLLQFISSTLSQKKRKKMNKKKWKNYIH